MPEHSAPLSPRHPPIHLWMMTALLISINVTLFAWQIFTGVDISNPSIADALRWGADYAPLTFLAEPQRLFSSMFFHFGLIHLMLNMWALYVFGQVAEQLFGRLYFLGMYVLAGLMGSLFSGLNSMYHSYQFLQQFNLEKLPVVSAGASGAVMGLSAALTVLSLLPVLPQQRLILERKTLLWVMAINLLMGFSITGINNAAHLGGMFMGSILVLLWYFSQKMTSTKLGLCLSVLLGAGLCWQTYHYCLQWLQGIEPLWQALLTHMQQETHL